MKDKLRLLSLSLVLFLFQGCAPIVEDRSAYWATTRKGPSIPVFTMETDFSEPLACMDHLIYNLGYETMPVFVEDIDDDSGKLKVGSRNMMISALTKMSKRSKAYKIYTYGINDSKNLISLFANAGRADPYLNIPPLTIKGSITQFDKAIDLRQMSSTIGFSDIKVDRNNDGDEITLANKSNEYYLGLGASSQSSLLGLDLVLINSFDMSVMPGVYSNNAMALIKHGRNYEIEALVKKTGFNLRYAYDRADAESQSYRNLIELGAIELTGRLYKMPYWACLSIDPAVKEIQSELIEWYYEVRDSGDLVSFLKMHLSFMGNYKGEIDNIPDQAFVSELKKYTNDNWKFNEEGTIPVGLFQAVINDFVDWYKKANESSQFEEKLENQMMLKKNHYKNLYHQKN